jgi:hypothetical protein
VPLVTPSSRRDLPDPLRFNRRCLAAYRILAPRVACREPVHGDGERRVRLFAVAVHRPGGRSVDRLDLFEEQVVAGRIGNPAASRAPRLIVDGCVYS